MSRLHDRWALGALVGTLAAALLWPAEGLADPDVRYTVRITPPDLGTVTSAASGTTGFRISPSSGVVTKAWGGGSRVSTHTTRALVSITCNDLDGGNNNCDNFRVKVRVGALGTASGRAGAPSDFTVQMGTAQLYSGPTGSSPTDFVLTPINEGQTVTFYLGMDIPVMGEDSSSSTGQAASGFYVYANRFPKTPEEGDTALAVLRVNKPLAVGAASHLNFGVVSKPTSGVTTVSVDAASGARTVSGLSVGLSTSSTSSAEYLVTGENQQALQITVPPTVLLSGPSALTVTTSNNVPFSPTLNTSGQFRFRVGGSVQISTSTPVGSYTGTIPVTVNYN